MAREIAEAPEVVARMLVSLAPMLTGLKQLFASRRPTHIVTLARGSSDQAAGYCKYLIEILLGLPCASVGPSVVSVYGANLVLRDCIVIAISQSGASPDALAFAHGVKRAGAPLVTITNTPGALLAQLADIPLDLSAGPEHSVAATKTFIASAALAARLIAEWADDRALIAAIERLPRTLVAANAIGWQPLEAALVSARSAFVLGRGPSLPMAGEAALKLKETCALHAESYSSAELIHGPMELISPDFPVLMFSPGDAASATNAATAARLRGAGAQVFATAADGLPFAPTGHPLLDPISMIQTFYGAAERISRARGRDPDRPQLLSKVTRTL